MGKVVFVHCDTGIFLISPYVLPYDKQQTKTAYILLVFVAVFVVVSGVFILDSFLHFLAPPLQKYPVLSLGIMVICGAILTVIAQVLQIVRFSKKRFTKHFWGRIMEGKTVSL